jgi:hypothetical protein
VRWFRPPETPTVRAQVVPFDDLGSSLPEGHPTVDADARADEIGARAAHVAWRFRT